LIVDARGALLLARVTSIRNGARRFEWGCGAHVSFLRS
jgi:hypothetical protein